MDNVVEIEPGYTGKSKLLMDAIMAVINEDQFGDMSIAEVLGTLDLVHACLMKAL